MQISVETISQLGRRVNVTVPSEEIENKINQELKKLSQTAKISGFRPGKAPISVIKSRYEKSVRQEVVTDLLRTTLYDALQQEKINPAGTPIIENFEAEEGKPLHYIASLEVYPEFVVVDFDKINVAKKIVEITDADIQKTLSVMQKQHAQWQEVDRPAEQGDRLLIDFMGTIDGQEFKGGSAKDVYLVIGDKRFFADFENGLIGAKKGEERTLSLTFPESTPEDIRNKKANFQVTVKAVAEAKLPELNDEFAERLGIKEGGFSAFKEQVRMHMQKELNQIVRQQVKSQVFEQLLSLNEFELPNSLITQELEYLHKQMHSMDHKGHKEHEHHEHSAEEHPELVEEAKKRVKLSLLLNEIISANQIKVDETKVRQLLEERAGSYDDPEQVVAWYYADPKRINPVKALALEEQIVDFILEKANVSEKTVTYDEVMKPEAVAA